MNLSNFKKFSIIIFFGLCIGISFLNINMDSIESTPETQVSEEIIIQSTPQSAYDESYNPNEASDFLPYGVTILGPSYVQRFPNQPNNNRIYYKPIDYNGNLNPQIFSNYEVYLNNSYKTGGYYAYDSSMLIEVDISSFITQVCNGSILFRIYHEGLHQWINKTTFLNVTWSVNLNPYYDSLKVTQYVNNRFVWTAQSSSGTGYYFSIWVDGVPLETDYYSGGSTGTYSKYFNDISLNQNLGIHNVTLQVRDNFASTALNQFQVEVVSSNRPNLEFFNFGDNTCSNNFILGESSAPRYHLRINDNDNDIDRFEFFAREYYGTIGVVHANASQTDYSGYLPTSFIPNMGFCWNNKVEYFVRVIDKNGKVNNINYEPILSLQVQNAFCDSFNGKLVGNLTMISGRTVVTQTVTPEEAEGEYRITFVIDTKSTTRGFLALISGDSYHHRFNNHHNRTTGGGKDENGEYKEPLWNIFRRIDIDQQSDTYAGVVFWIVVDDPDVIISMKVKIIYPQWNEPDAEMEEPPLKLLNFQTSCPDSNNRDSNSNNAGHWNSDNSTKITRITNFTNEIVIPKPGCYGYGMDSMDYQDDDNYNIPGYSVEFILCSIGIVSVILYKKMIRRNL